ncbi:hypothetical protein ACIGW8_18550 [Streptomyces sioyaensis]|uniref:hypothetical protein n=1 Tax=Streptomyces sioyaensis TaxID=67364 RepID=UPI0037D723D5
MDQAKLVTLLERAAIEGIYTGELATIVAASCEINSGEVSKESLLHTYRHRLRRTEVGTSLHKETYSLIDFLEGRPSIKLSMISVRPEPGGFHAFLADSRETRILFWMKMLDQSPEVNDQ